jgi:crossover junction endodeoxyribonuclease RuvC
MIVAGIDPGIHGGLAIVAVEDGAAPRLVEAIDVPVVGVNAKERVDAIAIRKWVSEHDVQHAFIERAQALPKQGSSSGFKYGRAVGAIEAAIALSGIPVTIVEPSVWKRFWRLPGKDKESSRQKALQLFPAAHAVLARKKDHGRAEATLIALYGTKS